MPLDLTRFHPVFFDETAEYLSTMELLLLHLDPRDPDAALLEDIGRAAHSIKGAGGTVGFRDMARLAGEVSALVAGVRQGRRPLNAELLQALQAACRALRAQLDSHRGGNGAADDAAARATALLRRLAQAPPAAADAKVSPPETAPDADARAGGAAASDDVMALLQAAGAGGLRDVTAAVRALGEAIERNAALAEQAAEDAGALRDAFRALVAAIAGLALSPARRPLPKVRRGAGASGNDKAWPEL